MEKLEKVELWDGDSGEPHQVNEYNHNILFIDLRELWNENSLDPSVHLFTVLFSNFVSPVCILTCSFFAL